MKIAIECKCLLLAKSLELFLKDQICPKEEANLIIEDAKRNASKIINDSLKQAAETDAEVVALKKQIQIYKARIKQVIEEQLAMVDDIDKIES